MIVGLVGCASQKLKHPAAARYLYTSALFKKASAYAERECDEWYILSAKHGLVHPDQLLEPYDLKLGTKEAGPYHPWRAKVQAQLLERHGPDVRVLALAGGQYTMALFGGPWTVEEPLKHMGIGQRLAWFTNN